MLSMPRPRREATQGLEQGVSTRYRAHGALTEIDGAAVIVRGKPEDSELIQRIQSDDPMEAMPPRSSGHKPLSKSEIAKLTEWVRQGAPYAKHWSYVNPVRPNLPALADRSWSRNPIDDFILARLMKEGLKPSPEADRAALIRRVSLDLTGLPPSLAEVDAFVGD